jgi:hypothetical protein
MREFANLFGIWDDGRSAQRCTSLQTDPVRQRKRGRDFHRTLILTLRRDPTAEEIKSLVAHLERWTAP